MPDQLVYGMGGSSDGGAGGWYTSALDAGPSRQAGDKSASCVGVSPDALVPVNATSKLDQCAYDPPDAFGQDSITATHTLRVGCGLLPGMLWVALLHRLIRDFIISWPQR